MQTLKMAFLSPQLPESMFSSYDPSYRPGYIAYTSKLRSDRGSIYGNATLQSRDFEPGLQRSSQLPVSSWGENYKPSLHLHHNGIISNIPRKNAENWNNKNGYFHPASGKYHIVRMNHSFDGDPRTSSAINAIEEIKYELTKPAKWMPSETDRYAAPLQNRLEAPKQTASCIREAEKAKSSCPPTLRNEKLEAVKNCFTVKHPSDVPGKNDFLQRRQGKIIYRTNTGLLPNYSGYTPGQMFLIGNTWGRSSVNALGKLQDQRFQWTSLF